MKDSTIRMIKTICALCFTLFSLVSLHVVFNMDLEADLDIESALALFYVTIFFVPSVMSFLIFRPWVAFCVRRMEKGKDKTTYYLLTALEDNLGFNRWLWVRGKYKVRLLDRLEKIYLRQLEGGEETETTRFYIRMQLSEMGREVSEPAIS